MKSPLIVINRTTHLVGKVVGGLTLFTKCQVLWSSGDLETIDLAHNRDKYTVCLEASLEVEAELQPDAFKDRFLKEPDNVFLNYLERRRINTDFIPGDHFIADFIRAFQGKLPEAHIRTAWVSTKKSWDKGKTVHLTKKSGKWAYKAKDSWEASFEPEREPALALDETSRKSTNKLEKPPVKETQVRSIFDQCFSTFTKSPIESLQFWQGQLSQKGGPELLFEALTDPEITARDRSVLSTISLGVSSVQKTLPGANLDDERKPIEALLIDLGPRLELNKAKTIRENPLALSIISNAFNNFDLQTLSVPATFALGTVIKSGRQSKTNISKLLLAAFTSLKRKPRELESWEREAAIDSIVNLPFGDASTQREKLSMEAHNLSIFLLSDARAIDGLNLKTLLSIQDGDFLRQISDLQTEKLINIVRSGIGKSVSAELLASLLCADSWFENFVVKNNLLAAVQKGVKAFSETESFQGKILNDGTNQKTLSEHKKLQASLEKQKQEIKNTEFTLEKRISELQDLLKLSNQRLKASQEDSERHLGDRVLSVGARISKALASSLLEVQTNAQHLSPQQLFGRLEAIASSAGMQVIGIPGDEVAFDESLHQVTSGEAQPGDKVKVTASGFTWLVSGKSHLLIKCEVSGFDL